MCVVVTDGNGGARPLFRSASLRMTFEMSALRAQTNSVCVCVLPPFLQARSSNDGSYKVGKAALKASRKVICIKPVVVVVEHHVYKVYIKLRTAKFPLAAASKHPKRMALGRGVRVDV